MQISLFRAAIVLGLMSTVGPFAIDMYLPAMPAIADDLGVAQTTVQATIITYFAAFGLAQLVYGPWADQSGRKRPILVGLTIFIIGSFGCAVAANVEALLAWRFVQGLGAAVVMVVPRAIIRDLHTGPEAARLMALIMMVISVSPMLAPLAGSGVIAIGSWRLIFYFLCAAALISILLAIFILPETLPTEKRIPINFRAMKRGSKTLLSDPYFMMLTLIGAFGMGSFFVFLSSAAFVYTGEFGLSPVQFSLAFAVNAIGFFSASQFAGPLGERITMARVVFWGTSVFTFFAVLLCLLALLGFATLPVIIVCLFCANAGLGLVIPSTMVMALDPHGEIAGLASSLGGAIQMVMGGLIIVATAPFFDGTALPMIGAIALCAIAAFVCAQLVLRRQKRMQSLSVGG
ncbi:Bcr/CflA family drug resistance efflux transporter [Amylibacter kogurei]|uniref:Bcr/CflA family efflux transporter n=1 Tax=Paramylibacter kogurei TaxID=1889778 RepID=A0A2G5K8Z7_9RHOB|nr:multidrug effflux MFS transporter [Amylibacter kogurei]PIB26008.1 Bcr/CflA family drug resistance efflux transporter [Amylibacter kogurei]